MRKIYTNLIKPSRYNSLVIHLQNKLLLKKITINSTPIPPTNMIQIPLHPFPRDLLHV